MSPEVPPTRADNGTDPLTPLNQRYATFQDLSNHYRLFVNRVSQQLATLGGGGAVSFDTLDDVGIDDIASKVERMIKVFKENPSRIPDGMNFDDFKILHLKLFLGNPCFM